MTPDRIRAFVIESNRIEGINRTPRKREIVATIDLLSLERVGAHHLAAFVSACAPGAELRTRPGMDVRVGDHRPPPGGPEIREALDDILRRANEGADPFSIHVEYETLHPFMDGNGRSGRALWAWMMERQGNRMLNLGFLHAWYYQTLSV